MDPIETIKVGGLTVEVHYDEEPQHSNPRSEDDVHNGVMLCSHTRYTLGDQNGDVDDFRRALERLGVKGFVRYLRIFHGTTVVLPLYLLDHSGLSMTAGQPVLTAAELRDQGRNAFRSDPGGWDTSAVGVIFDTAATREATGCNVEHIREALEGEVQTYDSYLRNEVYGYVVKNEDGEVLDSCWGYLGEADYCKQEGVSVAESYANDAERTAKRNEERHFEAKEILNTYCGRGNRFVVSLLVGYAGYEGDEIDTPEAAAAAALDLTRDGSSGDTHWGVFDRQTGVLHLLEQKDFEPQSDWP